MSLTRQRRVRVCLAVLVALFASTQIASPTKVVRADTLPVGSVAFLQWDDQGTSFRTFGANQAINISLGALDRIAIGSQVQPLGCIIGSHNDVLDVAANVYVVPSGTTFSVGDKLTNMATGDGSPDTIVTPAAEGVFVDETIGITAPSGHLNSGRYAVVYDECQDGIFEPWDAVFDPAFEVGVIDPNDPSIKPLKSISVMKEQAAQEAEQWKSEKEQYGLVFKLIDTVEWAEGLLEEDQGNELPLFELIYEKLQETKLLPPEPPSLGQPGLSGLGLQALANMESHYTGLKNDPADSGYNVLSQLEPTISIDPQSSDPVLVTAAELESSVSIQDALLTAFTDSIQRYQGAANAGDGQWALTQARSAQDYANLLLARLVQTDALLTSTVETLKADTRPLDSIGASLNSLATTVRASGLTAAQTSALQDLGVTQNDINSFQLALSNQLPFTKEDLEATAANIELVDTNLEASLSSFSVSLTDNIASLQADPLFFDQAPIATLAPGYSGVAGAPISFDASASTSPTPISEYAWDLEGDGLFDDATGSTASFTYAGQRDLVIGVLVTNAAGFQSVAYAPVTVAGANSRPTITSFSPQPALVSLLSGQSQVFSAGASDADGDSVSVSWTVDGSPAGEGGAFTYSPTAANIGEHVIEAVATDASPLGASSVQDWTVGVLAHPYDPTPPVIVPTLSPAPNSAGWNSGPVSLSWSVSDPDSGIVSSAGCGQTTLTTETPGTMVTCSAINGGSDSASGSVTIRIDETAPSTTATISPAPDPSGINTEPVVVRLASSDGQNGSGVDHIDYSLRGATVGSGVTVGASGSVPVSAEGVTSVTFRATDRAGNAESSQTIEVTVHQTAPVTNATLSPPPNVQGINSGNVTISLNAVPAPSGAPVASIRYSLSGAQTGGATVAGSSASTVVNVDGATTLTYFATDVAGNVERAKSLTINIQRSLTGYTLAPGYAMSIYASGFTPNCGGAGPVGMAFDPNGNLYVTEYQTGFLYKLPPGGGVASAADRVNSTPLPVVACGSAAGLTFSKTGRLYLADEFASAAVLEIDPTTGAVLRQVATGGCPVGLQTDPLTGNLMFTTAGCESTIREVSGFELGTPVDTVYANTPFSPDGITIAPDGTIYVATSTGDISEYAGTSAAVPGARIGLTNLATADGIAVQVGAGTGGANVLFVNRNNGTLTRLDLGTNPVTATDVFTGGSRGDFVAVGPDGCLYATQTTTILRVTKDDGTCSFAPTTVLPQLGLQPVGVAANVGSSQSLTAQLTNVPSPAGTNVTFTVTGANPQTGTALADSSGVAVFTYTGKATGQDQVVATATVGSTQLTSNHAVVMWSGSPPSDPPLITPLVSPGPNAAGWNNTAVKVGWAISDPSSPVVSTSGCDLITLTQDTPAAGTSVTCSATNANGQSSTASVLIRIDTTPPIISAAQSPGSNSRGWNNSNVTITFTCSDALSGIGTCLDPKVVTTEGAHQTVTGTAMDIAGNSASITADDINIDKTPPTITAVAGPSPDSAGWNNSPVTVTFRCGDALSGVIDCPAPILLDEQGALQSAAGSSTDAAGNSASVQLTDINIDMTPPLIHGVFLASTNTVRFTCADVLSGIATCPGAVVVPSGARDVAGTAIDRANNSATATVHVAPIVAKLVISDLPAAPTEGAPFRITVTAQDVNGAVVAGYRGTVHFAVSTGSAPADYTFTSTDAGVHTFAPPNGLTMSEEGNATVTVSDVADVGLTATARILVLDAPLTARSSPIVTPASFSGAVATFVDADPAGAASDYTAAIDWGDGAATSVGKVTAGPGGSFAVSGSHIYSALGPFAVTVQIADVGGSEATATTELMVFANPTGGTFIVASAKASLNSSVTFWGPTWATDNGFTGPLQLKGFAEGAANPSTCGGTWNVTPGNSPHPPDTVPQYMAVLVTSTINQNGSQLSGDITHIVIVKVNPGYGPAPGQTGSGTVVAVIC